MPLPYEGVVRDIRRGRVAPVYLLAGPDGLQQREVLGALARDVPELGITRVAGSECAPGDVVGLCRTPSFVQRRLVVVEEAPWIQTGRGQAGEAGAEEGDRASPRTPRGSARGKGRAAAEQPLLEYLDAPATGAVLVLRAAGPVDKRRRLSRKAAERGVVLEAVPPRDPTGWLRARSGHLGLALGPAVFATVARRLRGATCERMAAELDKLATFDGDIGPRVLERLLPPEPEERLYDLVDAALAGQLAPAWSSASALREQGEPVARILYALGGQLRAIVAVAEACREGARPEAVATGLGLHPFVARKALDQSRRLKAGAVFAAAEAVWWAEFGLKSGRLGEAAALDRALLGIIRAAGRLGD